MQVCMFGSQAQVDGIDTAFMKLGAMGRPHHNVHFGISRIIILFVSFNNFGLPWRATGAMGMSIFAASGDGGSHWAFGPFNKVRKGGSKSRSL